MNRETINNPNDSSPTDSSSNPLPNPGISRREALGRLGTAAAAMIMPSIGELRTRQRSPEYQLEGVERVVTFNDIRSAMDAGDHQRHVLVDFYDPTDRDTRRMILLEKEVLFNINHPAEFVGRIDGCITYIDGNRAFSDVKRNVGEVLRQAVGEETPFFHTVAFSTVVPEQGEEAAYRTIEDGDWDLRAVGITSEEQIAIPNATWTEGRVFELGEYDIQTQERQYAIAQLWDGRNSAEKIHLIIDSNQSVNTGDVLELLQSGQGIGSNRELQGTVWWVDGIDTQENLQLLTQRFEQMNQEVILRDEQPGTVRRIVVGDSNTTAVRQLVQEMKNHNVPFQILKQTANAA